jgi:hypothetical protein
MTAGASIPPIVHDFPYTTPDFNPAPFILYLILTFVYLATLTTTGDLSVMIYPDGGLQAWLVVLGSWACMIPSMGLLNTMAVLQARLSENELRNLPESTIGWILSSYAFFLYFCGAQVGMEKLSFLSFSTSLD